MNAFNIMENRALRSLKPRQRDGTLNFLHRGASALSFLLKLVTKTSSETISFLWKPDLKSLLTFGGDWGRSFVTNTSIVQAFWGLPSSGPQTMPRTKDPSRTVPPNECVQRLLGSRKATHPPADAPPGVAPGRELHGASLRVQLSGETRSPRRSSPEFHSPRFQRPWAQGGAPPGDELRPRAWSCGRKEGGDEAAGDGGGAPRPVREEVIRDRCPFTCQPAGT